ncbi:MAG TPA: rhomboid family intramembrane serine protease [Bacteroidia bacterium]|nr:rhomboid family intramembrane serine protease [Bacteroidia bacterium]
MATFTDDLKNVFSSRGNGLTRIIVINVLIFILLNLLDTVFKLKGDNLSLLYWLAIPGDIYLAISHVWTLVTYMFIHEGLMHILFNMLWLYWIGSIFVEYAGGKRLVGVYLLGGLSGGLLYLIVAFLAPLYFYNTFLLGASAGVMAVVIATAVLLPDYTINLLFFGPVRLKYVALASFILTSVLDISQNTGGKIAHIGGALFGVFFMLQYKNGKDMTKPITILLDRVQSLFKKSSRIRVSYRKKITDDEYSINQLNKQKRIDEILDKISKSGYDALTKEEKDFLFKVSGRN